MNNKPKLFGFAALAIMVVAGVFMYGDIQKNRRIKEFAQRNVAVEAKVVDTSKPYTKDPNRNGKVLHLQFTFEGQEYLNKVEVLSWQGVKHVSLGDGDIGDTKYLHTIPTAVTTKFSHGLYYSDDGIYREEAKYGSFVFPGIMIIVAVVLFVSRNRI